MYLPIGVFTQKPPRGNGFGSTPWLIETVKRSTKVPAHSPTHSINTPHYSAPPSTKTNTHSNVHETLKTNKVYCSNKLPDNNIVSSTQNTPLLLPKQTSPHVSNSGSGGVGSADIESSETKVEEGKITHTTSETHHTHLGEQRRTKKRSKMAAQFPASEEPRKLKKRASDHHIELTPSKPTHPPPLPSSSPTRYDHQSNLHQQPLVAQRGVEAYHVHWSNEVQMSDVLQRLQKLEEFQHAHSLEAIKVRGQCVYSLVVGWSL